MSILKRKINTESDLQTWKNSKSNILIKKVLSILDESVKSKKRSINQNPSPPIQKILDAFDIVQKFLNETPSVHQAAPFSNKGFVNFYHKISSNKNLIFHELTDNEEVIDYFLSSFGNPIRIDLGTGNELNFLAFITCLYELNIISLANESGQSNDKCEDLVFLVFWRYWDMLISIQRKFRLAPAGTHGSWGVDDFVCLPFVFGSSQLIESDIHEILPSNIINKEIAEKYKDDNSYCKWINYLYESKTGPFCQHSRFLYSLTSIKSFDQIHSGMIETFEAEVLNKFVVIQQFEFGTLIQLKE